ncbi:MAG TPA: transglutaminase family protein [Bryobacteraceae bacterium]|nr:transglutaminase family protein [Bryobacteraceae bacterium]
MNRYRLVHVTEFQYDGVVSESYNELHLRPRQDETQSCLSFRLSTEPAASMSHHVDYFGNWVHRFNVSGQHRHLHIEADSVVLVHQPTALSEQSFTLADLDAMADELDVYYDLLATSQYAPHVELLKDLVKDAEGRSGGTVAGFVRAATDVVHGSFRYEKGATHVHSSILDSLASGAGVCQDFAHILLAVTRMRGIPARYVSGYLVPRRAAEAGSNFEEVIGGQASHAWIEVYVPGAGWVGTDPTLGQQVSVQHVRVAYGRDYGDVPPVRGTYKGHAGQQLSVDVRVRPALDDEGTEHLERTAAAPPRPRVEEPPQQQQQQQ